MNRRGSIVATWLAVLAAVSGLAVVAVTATAQAQSPPVDDAEGIQLDFNDVELSVVIDTIARLTGRNFIYDDRVRGRVTIVSPTKVTTEQAYAVFESVLQVKGFTTVEGPGGVLKIIPIRDAKESSIETIRGNRPSPNRDQFVTRLIPLKYIDAEAITNTVKPMVSKDAAMVAYPPTNTIILTDTSANIRRLLSILDAIDVETYKEELAVIKVEHADAATLGQQISEIYGAEVSSARSRPATRATRRTAARAAETVQSSQRSQVRIITDDRTNSLLVLASRGQLEDIRQLVRKLDVEVTGGGSIRVYYLRHADAEELSQTLNGLVSGSGAAAVAPGRTGAAGVATSQALRSVVTELAGGVTLTADPATNSLVIQGSKEAYETLRAVIDQLDISRPQVLVEALIMEVDITDGKDLGFNAVLRLIGDDYDIATATITDGVSAGLAAGTGGLSTLAAPLIANAISDTTDGGKNNGTLIQGVLRAAKTDGDIDIVSAPHILTSDNEEAEIRIGNNIPIITSRVQSAAGVDSADDLATSVNVERQDIGVTLRVTPQISEGDSLRLRIFQELTAVNDELQTGSVDEVGVALTSRRIENTVVVSDGQTVVIGGLIGEASSKGETKVPFLGDIPILGWAFKTRTTTLRKENLLVFLTPHIVRSPQDLEFETVRKREQFQRDSRKEFDFSDLADTEFESDAVRRMLVESERRSPQERMREIEESRAVAHEMALAEARQKDSTPTRFHLRAGPFRDVDQASGQLTELIDAGYDGNLVSGETDGVVLFELILGPFQSIFEAQAASNVLESSYGLDSQVVVSDPDEEAP